MKELSIEEKAKAYDEAIKRAKDFMNGEAHYELKIGENIMCWVFPELRESGDERMRAMAIKAVYAPEAQSCIKSWGINPDDVIAWLEKQGEHAKFRDSIQVGDKVTRNEDGVLVNLSQLNRVAKKDEKQSEKDKFIEKELEHIKGYREKAIKMLEELEKQDGQKPWSEEDEAMLRKAIITIDNVRIDTGLSEYYQGISKWLESIKDRVQLQPKQAWSEEDEDYYDAIITKLEVTQDDALLTDNQMKFLISLKDRVQPQTTWKPSDEQLDSLYDVLNPCDGFNREVLESLYVQLKKIREE